MDRTSLRKLIRKMLMESFEEFTHPFHIVVLFDKSDKDNFGFLTEGDWKPSSENGYWQRLDTPKFGFEKLHVHIAKQKHINAKNKQVAWNDDGTRHDKKSFNQNFNGMEKAKEIARKALCLPSDTVLENVVNKSNGELLLESIECLPTKSSIFIFEVVKGNRKQLLFS
jgi:hypothetical protein